MHTGRPEPKPNKRWASVAMGFTGADLHLALDFTGPGLDWALSSLGLVFT